MSGERFQRSPNYPWKRERDPTKHRPFLSQKESPHRVFQNGSTRSRFMGCHDRIFKENEIKTGGLKENTMFTLIKGGILYPDSRKSRPSAVDECIIFWSGCRPTGALMRNHGLCPWGSTVQTKWESKIFSSLERLSQRSRTGLISQAILDPKGSRHPANWSHQVLLISMSPS